MAKIGNKKTQARVKLRAKAKKAAWENNEPELAPMDYSGSLVKLLNFHNAEVDDKLKQGWAIAYWKSKKKVVTGLASLKEGRFRQVGVLIRQLDRGAVLEQKHLDFIDDKYDELIKEVQAEKEVVVTETKSNRPNVQDAINAQVATHAGEIAAAIDEFCLNATDFDVKDYLKKNQISSVVAKRIGNVFLKDVEEFKMVALARERAAELKKMKIKEDAMTPEQLFAVDMNSQMIEAYSHLSAVKLRHVTQFVNDIVDGCNVAAAVAKATKKPRVKKEKPAAVLVAKLKWLPDFEPLQLKSIRPEKIVTSDTVYLYDTVKRRIIRYIAQDGMLLSARGGSIMNFDPVKSGSKILRKPEIQLKGVSEMTKRPINEWFNTIKATSGTLKGRLSASMIILNTF
jgi:hypothetical protein